MYTYRYKYMYRDTGTIIGTIVWGNAANAHMHGPLPVANYHLYSHVNCCKKLYSTSE